MAIRLQPETNRDTYHSAKLDYSPESWKIDPFLLSDAARQLWYDENQAPVVIAEDNSLRPKILDACGMTCVFCHNEGTPVVSEVLAGNTNGREPMLGRVSIYAATNGVDFLPGRMNPNYRLEAALSAMQAAVGVGEVHLTGGEPTLHPELPDIISLAKGLGLSVKMTSNGENPRAFEKCAAAGLDKVVFSVFGTDAESLALVQHPKYRNVKLAQRKIDSLRASIEQTAEHGITATANVVVPGPGHEERVSGILDEFDHLSLRLLNSLDDGSQSYAAIYEILAGLKAVPQAVKLTAGSSNARIAYRLPNGSDIAFKQIRPARFSEVCNDCDIDERGECEEGFYGLRLYINDKSDFLVGVCLQRMDLVMPIDEFLGCDLPKQILDYRASEKQSMEQFFNGRAMN